MNPATPSHPSRCDRTSVLCLLAVVVALALPIGAADKLSKHEKRDFKREMGADPMVGGKPAKRDSAPDSKGDRPTANDNESRALAKLRERLEVTDDTEWELIAERIRKVEEARRNLAASGSGGKGGLIPSKKGKTTSRTGASAHSERDALRSAVGDNLTDAEIKARLDRVREVHEQNERQLAKAQADLRAVLTIRQEAVAVMAGLLAP
jgi:hypothetical protein